jgi:hypothetical protein
MASAGHVSRPSFSLKQKRRQRLPVAWGRIAMSDHLKLSVAIGHVLRTSRPCKNPQCSALVTSRAKGSGRQREYCSTSCRRHYIYSLRAKPSKRLNCKNCGAPIRQPTGRGRPRLWCSIRCRDRDQYRRYRESRLARSKAWREANPERVRAFRKAWYQANAERIKAASKRFSAGMRISRGAAAPT